jgi:arylsulfatase A-like enzyme
LYSEHLHVPGLLRYPNSDLAMRRLKRFVQPADLYATLLEWFDVPRPDEIWGRSIPSLLAMDESGLAQELAAAASPNERLLRTRAWLWKQREGESASQLFTKPDDRWEVNEVANRCPKIVDRMELAFDAFRAAAMNNRRSELPQVDEELYDIFR